MTPEQRTRIDEIEEFRRDMQRFAALLENDEHASSRRASDERKREEMRQSLLRRAGRVKPIFERVIGGRLSITAPYGIPRQDDIWDVALTDGHPYNQAYYAGQLADRLNMVIGRLEDDPSLLDRPPAASRPTPSPTMVHIHGGTVQIGQVGPGSIGSLTQSQSAASAADADELRRLIAELEDAIRALVAPDQERQDLVEPVSQLKAELAKPKPRYTALLPGWNWVKTIAALNGAWSGWNRVQHLAAQALPHLDKLLQLPGN